MYRATGQPASETTLVGDAEDAVTDARTAARRSDPAGLQDALAALADVADQLVAAEAQLR